jgi:branched-chain amino acid aminotransferase
MALICLDGAIVPPEQAVIPVTDEGLLRGDGVFEVVRLYAGRPYALDAHLERMRRSAENLRLPLDIAAVAEDAAALLAATRPGDAAMRLLATRGGHRIALIEALPNLPETLAVGCVTYSPTRVLDGIKSLSYAANMLCSRLARERGFDEALLVTPHGRVLEAPTATFFWVGDDELRTPPLDDHLLDSITRRAVMSCCEVREVHTTLDDLRGAQEAFLASSLKEVMPVHRIEDIELSAPGPVTARAADRVMRHVADQLAAAAQ